MPASKTSREEPELALATTTATNEIITTRIFNAGTAKVFKAWSDPNHLKSWWDPKGFTNTFYEFDFRPGGTWKFEMHGPDGKNYPNTSVFVEIEANKRIVFDHVVLPLFRSVVTFEDLGGKTKLTSRMIFDNSEIRDKIARYALTANEENMDRLLKQLDLISL